MMEKKLQHGKIARGLVAAVVKFYSVNNFEMCHSDESYLHYLLESLAELGREALERRGFEVAVPREMLPFLCFECWRPTSTPQPDEDIKNSSDVESLAGMGTTTSRELQALKALNASGLYPDEPLAFGHRIIIFLRIFQRPKAAGRPRTADAVREKIRLLRAAGKSWTQVALIMNRNTGQVRSPGAYRYLISRSSRE